MAKKPEIEARVLSPEEYPESLTTPRGAYTPRVLFAAQHPLGLYHVEDHGANVHAVYFTPRRARKPKIIANAGSMAGAFKRISDHEDQLVHPAAAREEGKQGPVSIYALGKRTGEPKPQSQLDRELDAWLVRNGYQAITTHHLARKVHQEPTGRAVFAAHERGGHITTSGRRALTRQQFALPPGPEEKRRGIKGRLPIDSSGRAHDALTRASMMHRRGHITARELQQARDAVHRAWPSIQLSHR